ncbi:MAG: 1-(5-phosphoribosyl)-5-[(5-phosphoribosylamino)methylideneamino]imidazole-4-carboxamide isomerase [Pseudomonadota bacterium]
MTTLTLYPAIDLKDGKCVRLLHGEMDKATVYHEDPAAQAKAFETAGFDTLHIVDLDGAFSGESENRARVQDIIASTGARTQLGGGIRTMTAVEGWLEAGIGRVILGTAAVEDPAFVQQAAAAFPGQIVVGIDARDGRVKTAGWGTDTSYTATDIARRFEDYGVAAIVFTDIGRDGALSGVNVEATASLAKTISIPVIASGGVASTQDITALRVAGTAIEGVIIGRALYDGRLDASTALRLAREARGAC